MRIPRIAGRILVPVAMTVGTLAATMPNASAAALPGCTTHGPIHFCFHEEDSTGIELQLVDVSTENTHVADVAAYRDVYQIDVGQTEVRFSCIRFVVDDETTNACAQLGGDSLTLVSSTPLAAQSVDVPTPVVGESDGTVYVCRASITLLVDNEGVENAPGFTVCADGLPDPA